MRSDAAKYKIIQSRDKGYDGTFFFAVRTTGIVCRPSCPAARPLAKNVVFFDTLESALASGFRHCKRCKPQEIRSNKAVSSIALLDKKSVRDTAQTLGMSERQLRRVTLDQLGATPKIIVRARRIMEAKRLLSQTQLDIIDVAFSSGFNSLRQFNDVFKREIGLTPSLYREENKSKGIYTDYLDIAVRIPFKKPIEWSPLKEALLAHTVPGLEVVDEEAQTLTRLLVSEGRQTKVTLDLSEPVDAVSVTVSVTDMADVDHAVRTIKRVLDLDADPARVEEAFQDDNLIGPRNRRLPGLRVCGMFEPFEVLINTIIGQQVSVAAARTFSERLVREYGKRHGELYIFPTARKLLETDPVDLYQKTRINHKKIATIQAVCRLLDGGFDLDSIAKNESARKELLAIKGIGPWTVEYVVLRGYGERDGFPADDLLVKRSLKVKTGKAAELLAEKWRPYRGYATMYLWTK